METEICRFSDNETFTDTVRIVFWNGTKSRTMVSLHCNHTAIECRVNTITRQCTAQLSRVFDECEESGNWIPFVECMGLSGNMLLTDEERRAIDTAMADLDWLSMCKEADCF